MTPGRNPSIRTSAFAAKCLSMSRPSGEPRLRVIDFLLREWVFHQRETPLTNGPQLRRGSPVPGRSTLTTSPPKSAMRLLAVPPATMVDRSNIFRPINGPFASITMSSGSVNFGMAKPQNIRTISYQHLGVLKAARSRPVQPNWEFGSALYITTSEYIWPVCRCSDHYLIITAFAPCLHLHHLVFARLT